MFFLFFRLFWCFWAFRRIGSVVVVRVVDADRGLDGNNDVAGVSLRERLRVGGVENDVDGGWGIGRVGLVGSIGSVWRVWSIGGDDLNRLGLGCKELL